MDEAKALEFIREGILKYIIANMEASATLEAAKMSFYAALISVAASIFIGVGSLVYSYKSLKESRSRTYKEIVTKERIEWLTSLRIDVAAFISSADSSLKNIPSSDRQKYLEKMKHHFWMIKLRIKPQSKLDEEKEIDMLEKRLISNAEALKKLVEEIYLPRNYFEPRVEVESQISLFIETACLYNKAIWDSIMNESIRNSDGSMFFEKIWKVCKARNGKFEHSP